MKKILFLILMIPIICQSQGPGEGLKISAMPTFIGNPAGGYIPIVIGSTNRKIDAALTGYNKIETITIGQGPVYDTIHTWKNGVKSGYVLSRAGGGIVSETDPLFDSKFSAKSTSDLPEGLRLYFTTARSRGALSSGFAWNYNSATGQGNIDVTALLPFVTDSVDGEYFEKKPDGTLTPKPAKYNGTAKVLPAADYTILETDELLILPDHASTYTLTLPAASTMQRQVKTIYCIASDIGEWILAGSFVQYGTVGTTTENFSNAGLASVTMYRLVSVLDGATWRWFDLK